MPSASESAHSASTAMSASKAAALRLPCALLLPLLLMKMATAGHEARSALAEQPAATAAAAGPPHKRARKLPSDEELEAFQAALGYNFTDPWLLRQALVHPSYGEFNNARLTWLGDAVLGAAVSDLLYQALPDGNTAELHEQRKVLVRRDACAAAAKKLGLAELLVVGKGYEGKAPTTHMLAEAFEAVWGAVYADASFNLTQARAVYSKRFPLPRELAADRAVEGAQ